MTSHKPVVTVIMAIKGKPIWLKEALASVRSQNFRDWNFIACLDGPNQEAANIISQSGEGFSFIQADPNTGAAMARNLAIRQSSSDLIACLDYDDAWAPNHLAYHVNNFRKSPDLVLGGTSAIVIDHAGKRTGIYREVPRDLIKFQLLIRNCFVQSSVVFRREAAISAGLYDREMGNTEDYEFWLRLALLGKVRNSKVRSVFYRVHGEQLSLQFPRQDFSAKILFAKRNLARQLGLPASLASVAHSIWEKRNSVDTISP